MSRERRGAGAFGAFVPILVALGGAGALGVGGCGWDLGKVFDRDDPRVEEARRALEASVSGGGGGDAAPVDADLAPARTWLEEVTRFRCESDGGRDLVVQRPGASLDLGLLVFRVAELIGNRFGDEELQPDGGEVVERGESPQEQIATKRSRELDCAHLLLGKLANDPETPRPLALRARYLLGNFAFLARRYRDAIEQYDRVLVDHPARGADPAGDAGPPQDDDAVARDAAWNRAIALKRLEDQRDAGQDASDSRDAGDDARNDSGSDSKSPPDSGQGDSSGDKGRDSGQPDAGGDGSPNRGGDDAGRDATPPSPSTSPSSSSSQQPPPPASASAAPPAPSPMPSSGVDLRELDKFDKKAPLDLDMPQRMRERRRIPRSLDK